MPTPPRPDRHRRRRPGVDQRSPQAAARPAVARRCSAGLPASAGRALALLSAGIPALLPPASLGAALALGLAAAPAARAVPRLDLSAYPAAAAGERRWVVQLPGVLPPSRDPSLSSNPEDWRVELIAGRTLELDCNRHVFNGRMRSQAVPGSDLRVVRITEVTPVASTRMACPPGEPKRRVFLPMGGKPFVVPYNASRPIVLYAPADLELRWRLWKAERRQWPARPL